MIDLNLPNIPLTEHINLFTFENFVGAWNSWEFNFVVDNWFVTLETLVGA